MSVIRILGVALERNNKMIHIALRSVYGIGPTLSKKICSLSNVEVDARVKDLDDTAIEKIRDTIKRLSEGKEDSLPYQPDGQPYLFEGELSRAIKLNIKRLMDIGCYRGKRHRSRLPLRGQNTKNNAKTRKRSRRTK